MRRFIRTYYMDLRHTNTIGLNDRWPPDCSVGKHYKNNNNKTSLRHHPRAQSQGHHAIDHLEERGVERGSDLPWKDERGPSSIRRRLEHWGNFWETGWSAYGLFRARRYHLELNWTEPNNNNNSVSCPEGHVIFSLGSAADWRGKVTVIEKTFWLRTERSKKQFQPESAPFFSHRFKPTSLWTERKIMNYKGTEEIDNISSC